MGWSNASVLSTDHTIRARTRAWFIGTLVVWGTAVAIFGFGDWFEKLPTLLLPVPLVLGIALPVAVYGLSPDFRAYIRSINIRFLTLFNVWRIPAGVAFLWYGGRGLLPEWFSLNAGWGDIAAGLLAPIVVFGWGARRSGERQSYLGFHLFSLLDFVVAVGTGLLFTVLQDPRIDTLKAFPLVVIPLFGVPVTGALSLMTIHRLLAKPDRS